MLDKAIHWINHYVVEVLAKPITLYIHCIEVYLVDRIALSTLEQLGPDLVLVNKVTISLATNFY